MNTQPESLKNTGPTSDDGTTCEPSRQRVMIGESTSLPAGSPVRTSVTPDNVPGSTANGPGCGASLTGSLAFYDRESSSWKTWQRCLFGGWVELLETWPRAGMTQNGELYRLADPVALARHTEGNACLLWRTPGAHETSGGLANALDRMEQGHAVSLSDQVNTPETWPTPRASEWKGTGPLGSKSHKHRLDRGYLDATVQEREKATGQLNPTWVEWLMGFPLAWTDCEGLETPSCRK